MYTRKAYKFKDLVWWTRHELCVFVLYSVAVVMAYELGDLKWLRLPWLPVALVGTAVAFIISFQNNASYGRLWEARKIWGGIVNASRSWALKVNDFVTNDFTSAPVGAEELTSIKRDLIYRHLAWLTGDGKLIFTRADADEYKPVANYRVSTNRTWALPLPIDNRIIIKDEDSLTCWRF